MALLPETQRRVSRIFFRRDYATQNTPDTRAPVGTGVSMRHHHRNDPADPALFVQDHRFRSLYGRALYHRFRFLRDGADRPGHCHTLDDLRADRHSSAHPDRRYRVYDRHLHHLEAGRKKDRHKRARIHAGIGQRADDRRDGQTHLDHSPRYAHLRSARRVRAVFPIRTRLRLGRRDLDGCFHRRFRLLQRGFRPDGR